MTAAISSDVVVLGVMPIATRRLAISGDFAASIVPWAIFSTIARRVHDISKFSAYRIGPHGKIAWANLQKLV